MMPISPQSRIRFLALFAVAAFLCVVQPARHARAVDFAFYYDDAAGQGFLDPVQGPARRTALEAAAEVWGRLILPSYDGETIGVRAKFDSYPAGSTTLAAASPIYLYSDFGSSSPQYQSDTNYPKALANHLAGRDLAPVRQEIQMSVNVAPMTPFYFGLDGMPPAGQNDFVTVAAHEIGHGLGFYDTFRQDGDFGLLGDKTYHDFCLECLPTPYDTFLTLGPSGPTLISLDDDPREAAMTSNNVFWNGTNGIAGNGGMAPKIHAPATWSDGSSIAHLDATTFPMDLMRPNYYGVDQSPSAYERGMMRDMGWTIAVGTTAVSWTGLGSNDNATTVANWSPALPLPGDSLTFDTSPRMDVQMDLLLGTIQGISFPATAPAYTLRFKSPVDVDLTGSGIINSSASAQTIFLESYQDDNDPIDGHGAAALTFKNTANAGNSDYHLRGGGASIQGGPAPNFYILRPPGASVAFQNNSTAGTASFEIEGGSGDGGPNAQVTFRNNSTASGAEFRTKGGRLGPSLPFGATAVGLGGQVRFENNSKAGIATFHNEGQADTANGGGGFTIFADDSDADHAEVHNHGATYLTGYGGATYFEDHSTAGSAMITNHADGSNHVNYSAQARTVFVDDSNAGMATIENEGAPSQSQRPGRTEFHNNSSAANATINNRGHINVGDLAGRTLFYDDSTAANATLSTFNGYSDHGRIEFRNRSTAADANIFIDNNPMVTASLGGYLNFYNDSTAARSNITLRTGNAGFGGLQFYDNATAGDAQVVAGDNGGSIVFWGTSTAGDPIGADTPEWANFTLGQGNVVSFWDQSTADDAHFTLADRAQIFFQANSSAGHSQIAAAGGSVYTASPGATITFNSNSTADHATILVTGATAPLASPAAVWFINGSHAGNSTLIANGGTGGGAGATVTFTSGATGDTARLVANAGGTFDFAQQFAGGTTTVGSIDGAGTFYLRGTELVVGTRNIDSTVTGQIVDTLVSPTYSGGRLKKVGTGTLTLAGANTYSGLTTVAEGRLLNYGSIAGDVLVQSGAIFGGTGTLGGTLTVGGKVAPGASPGTITVGGLTMLPGGILELELGDPGDQIIITGNGNVALDGILNVSLVDGFIPTLGQSFSVFAGAIGALTGAFDEINAPIINGLTFSPMQSATELTLDVVEAMLVPGDYNGNGTVDAADYIIWRKNLGSGTSLLADDTPGVGPDDYDRWRAHFGQTTSSGAAPASVPESTSSMLAVVLLVSVLCRRPVYRGTPTLRDTWAKEAGKQ